jgi:uncharacterized protein (TIGR02246 family)
MIRASMVALIAAFLFASCGEPRTDVAQVKKAIEEMTSAASENMLSGDADRMVAHYADDVTLMAPNSDVVKGKAAVKDWMASMLGMGLKFNSVTFTTMEIDAAGGIAYQIGTYDMTMDVPGMPGLNDKGKFVTIWKKQADGTWKIHVDSWNTSMPMPGS